MTNSCIFENLLWSKTLAVTFPARCRKYFSCLKLHSKLIGLELLIIIIPFEKPKIEVQIFDRTSLSGFAMKGFTTKEGFNTKNQALLLIKLRSCFKLRSSYKDICCIKVKCSLFLNYSFLLLIVTSVSYCIYCSWYVVSNAWLSFTGAHLELIAGRGLNLCKIVKNLYQG